MEIHLTAERGVQLADLAQRQGREPAVIADEALAVYLDHAKWLAEAVEESRTAAKRGDLLDHEDVVRMIERRYRADSWAFAGMAHNAGPH